MKTQGSRIECDAQNARSVLECGGPPPLFPTTGLLHPAETARGLAHSKTCRIALLRFCFLLSALCFQALGQFSIDWSTTDGGGGTSTNGQYSITGTIGQPDANPIPLTNGQYSVTGGFWSLISVVQTAGAPTLYISHTGNTMTVYWQNTSAWSLQQNGNLTTPAGWSASAGVTTSNGTNYLNLVNPAGNLFFRLKNQ